MATNGKDPAFACPGLVSGMLSPLKGARFIFSHKKLLPLAAIPILVNALIFGIIFFVAVRYFGVWLDSLIPKTDVWYWTVLSYFLIVLISAALLLAMAFVFTAAASIIASPFNDELSSQTERIVTGKEDAPFSIKNLISEAGRGILEELKKIAFYLFAVCALLMLNLIPILGQFLYTACFTLLTIFWLALNFLDYALTRRHYRFSKKMRFLKTHARPVFGYGLGVFGGVLIPLFNLIFIPAVVVGGTLLFLDIEKATPSNSMDS